MRGVKDEEEEEEDVDFEDDDEKGEEEEEEEEVQEADEELDIYEQLAEVEEDNKQPEEDEGEKDLFDLDENEDSAKTTAVSSIKPPRPAPPTNFPKRQDYHEASGGAGMQGGGGRHGGGRGGRHGDRERYGGGGRHKRNNSGGGQSYGGGGNLRYQHENLVAEMKLGASGHADASLRLKCPSFQEPSQLACYSRASDGSVHWDDRCLRRFRSGILSEAGADLNEGYESYVEKTEDTDGSGYAFRDLLACLRAKRIALDNIHFVTFRNNLNKILGTAYNRRYPWEMGVYKRFGTIYLDVRKLPEGPRSEQQRRFCYWGYSFERVATENRSGPRSGSEMSRLNGAAKKGALDNVVVDANVEFCAVLRTKLGRHRIIMGAEMDCYEPGRDDKKSYIELKTSRELEPRTVDKFEREKLLTFWIQSFLAGVPRIVCGFRDDGGRIVRSEMMSTKDIPNRVKQKHFWEGGVCLAFADQVFCWLYGSVKENEDYLLRFIPAANRLELLRESSCPEIITKHLEDKPQIVEVFYAQQQQQTIEQSRTQNAEDLIEKNRLIKKVDDKAMFQGQALGRRHGEFEKLLKGREERLAELRLARQLDCERRRKMENHPLQEEARLLRIKEEEEAWKREEDEKRRQEEAERRAKYDEIAALQRQREADAEERAKGKREAMLAKADEGRTGRFVLSRKRQEDPVRTDSAPPTEERKPLLFSSSRVSSAREDGDKWQRPAERAPEQSTGPTEAAAPPGCRGCRYEPPVRREGRYKPPVRCEGTYEPPVRHEGRYEPPVRREGRYKPPVRREGTYEPPVRREGTYEPPVRHEGRYEPPVRREGRYEPPVRREGRYEPPVRRTSESYNTDAPPPRTTGGRFSDRYADRDREPQRPAPFSGDRSERGVEDR